MRSEQGAIHLEVLSAIRGRIRLQLERPISSEIPFSTSSLPKDFLKSFTLITLRHPPFQIRHNPRQSKRHNQIDYRYSDICLKGQKGLGSP